MARVAKGVNVLKEPLVVDIVLNTSLIKYLIKSPQNSQRILGALGANSALRLSAERT